MTARNDVSVFAIAFFGLIQPAPTTLETVWVKEVITRLQTDKRTHGDTNLPNELSFHLRRSSETLSLNLRRNHDINPRADFYFAHKSNDDETTLVKSPNWKTEDVAYYQDMENAAYVIVRCVQESNTHCQRIINGHLRIRDTSYELLPAANDVNSRNLFEVTGRLGKQYVLKYQSFIQSDVFDADKDTEDLKEEVVKQELTGLVRRLGREDKQHLSTPIYATLSTQNIPASHKREPKDLIRKLTDVYYVKIAVLIDSGLWDFYSSMVPMLNPTQKRRKVMENIRQSYSYIMNGVSLIYNGIEDEGFSIKVILTDFIVFKSNAFPHIVSKVETINGTKYIDLLNYRKDFKKWDKTQGVKNNPVFDHGMLFTRYKMYVGSDTVILPLGVSFHGGVCFPGKRTAIVAARGLFRTVFIAAHELGHNLGAEHDGDGSATSCDPESNFIMSSKIPNSSVFRNSRNPWHFSNCSVEAFFDTLNDRQCVRVKGSPYSNAEYEHHLTKKPGVVYNATEQCRLIIGQYSTLCETSPEDVCHAMRCTYPATGECMEKHHIAADGTECGQNQWCVAAWCVPKILGV